MNVNSGIIEVDKAGLILPGERDYQDRLHRGGGTGCFLRLRTPDTSQLPGILLVVSLPAWTHPRDLRVQEGAAFIIFTF